MFKIILCTYLAAVELFWVGYYLFVPKQKNESPRTITEFIAGVLIVPFLIPLLLLPLIASVINKK